MTHPFKSLAAVVLLAVVSTIALAEEGRKAILITGASSGIGRSMAETFAAKGFHVYAGARKQEDMDALNAIENIQAVRLDVTKQEEIDAAAAFIKAQGHGLYGLVNNAGVGVIGPMIEVSEEDLHFQMNVNVYGPYRVTRAMAPMLIESKGRISTISSISGVLAWPMGGPYTMSKHAIEAYGDTLALEMQKFGVAVSLIEPGNYKSSISDSLVGRLKARGFDGKDSRYAEEWARILEGPTDRAQYKEPDEVTEAAMHFMTSDEPLPRYMVVPAENEAERTIRRAIQELVELNEWQAWKYDREALVKMLDEALAAPTED